MTLYRGEGSFLSSARMRTVTPHNHGPLSAVRECINLIHTSHRCARLIPILGD